MTSKPKKQKFIVEDNETIDDCLDRMRQEGYFPVRRMEQPIFKEEIRDNIVEHVPCGRMIVFEGKLL
ncbi:NETI motif-containing protein [Metabacillus sp. FJAT-53654]|uniref:NETI motif-containing protein n=1 Tax=Metabacillus rhizosphaerae TaxID=3117747 RepID=A0ABZ2MUM6_9BACI